MCIRDRAITGGYMTLAAMLCADKVATTLCAGEAGVLMHGPTFMGNPLACAVAVASIDLLLNSPWQSRVVQIQKILKKELLSVKTHSKVKAVRILGAIGVIELHESVNVAQLQKYFVENGVWIRPFRNLVYIMPPYIIEERDLIKLCTVMKNIL